MESITFTTSLAAFYVKGTISQNENFLNLKVPNTVLGLIPFGSSEDSIPISQITDVKTNFKLNTKDFIIGIVLVLAGFFMLTQIFLVDLLFMLLGILLIIDSFQSILVINTSAGIVGLRIIPFIIFEKKKANDAKQLIINAVNNRLNDTNNRIQTDRIVNENRIQTDRVVNENRIQTDRIVDAMNNKN